MERAEKDMRGVGGGEGRKTNLALSKCLTTMEKRRRIEMKIKNCGVASQQHILQKRGRKWNDRREERRTFQKVELLFEKVSTYQEKETSAENEKKYKQLQNPKTY